MVEGGGAGSRLARIHPLSIRAVHTFPKDGGSLETVFRAKSLEHLGSEASLGTNTAV